MDQQFNNGDEQIDIVARLRNTPNWLREPFNVSWKDLTNKYDRAPFVAADEIVKLREENARLKEELAAVQKDAERYRWLHKEHDLVNPLAVVCWKRNADRSESDWVNTINAENLDKAIDAAIAIEKREKK